MMAKSLQEKIGLLSNENSGLNEEIRVAQDNLRLSANQNKKMLSEIA